MRHVKPPPAAALARGLALGLASFVVLAGAPAGCTYSAMGLGAAPEVTGADDSGDDALDAGEGPPDGSIDGASRPDAGDAATNDARADGPTTTGDGGRDTGTGDPAPDTGTNGCGPTALAETPAWSPPNAIHQNVCTLAQANAFNQACFGTDVAACRTYVAANAACSKCLISQGTDPSWGPVVDFATVGATINVGGCIAAAEPQKGACGADTQRAYGCELSVCAQCEQTSHDAYLACTRVADQGVCSPWAANRDACLVTSQQNNAARCLGGPPNNDLFLNAAMLFCGANGN